MDREPRFRRLTGWAYTAQQKITDPLRQRHKLGANAIIASLSFSAAVGIFFGYYPARKAAALDPIEAQRYE